MSAVVYTVTCNLCGKQLEAVGDAGVVHNCSLGWGAWSRSVPWTEQALRSMIRDEIRREKRLTEEHL